MGVLPVEHLIFLIIIGTSCLILGFSEEIYSNFEVEGG